VQGLGGSVAIEGALTQVIIFRSDDLDGVALEMTIETGNGSPQRLYDYVVAEMRRSHAHAELAAFEAGFEKGRQRVEKVFPGLVEEAQVGAPWNLADGADTGVPHLEPPGGTAALTYKLKALTTPKADSIWSPLGDAGRAYSRLSAPQRGLLGMLRRTRRGPGVRPTSGSSYG
jgi:hypothetical protein